MGLLLAGCLHEPVSKASGKLMFLDHPLVDKIWDVNQGQYIDQASLSSHLLAGQYLLLGETHDNIRHHQLQAEIIQTLVKAKRQVTVHFEMIDDGQQQSIDQANIKSTKQLIDILKQAKSGWPYESMYQGVFDVVLQAAYPLYAANLNQQSIGEIFKHGESVLPEDIKTLMNSAAMTKPQRQSLQAEIKEGHCNALPEKMVDPMVLLQRAKDAHMALSMIASDARQRVLISGSGHARNDRGVPMYLKSKDSNGKIISIGFLEVIEGRMEPNGYVDRWGHDRLPFDYVWFTPRFDRHDPCQGFAEKMKDR